MLSYVGFVQQFSKQFQLSVSDGVLKKDPFETENVNYLYIYIYIYNGEDIVELMMARMCVAVTLVDSDPKVVQSLTAILQEAGIDTIQHDVMSDNRISRLLRTLCVTTNDDMLSLLIEHGDLARKRGIQEKTSLSSDFY